MTTIAYLLELEALVKLFCSEEMVMNDMYYEHKRLRRYIPAEMGEFSRWLERCDHIFNYELLSLPRENASERLLQIIKKEPSYTKCVKIALNESIEDSFKELLDRFPTRRSLMVSKEDKDAELARINQRIVEETKNAISMAVKTLTDRTSAAETVTFLKELSTKTLTAE